MTLLATHLYPRHMSLYGDRGNLLALRYRAQRQGIGLEVRECDPGQEIDPGTKLIFLGGGQDRDQNRVVRDLLGRRELLRSLIQAGTVFVGVCGGFQMLGESYEAADGSCLQGLKFANLHTINAGAGERLIGNVAAYSKRFGWLVGFQNHGGMTFLGPGMEPLGEVWENKCGNNGSDGREGLYYPLGEGLLIGSYLHGLLPRNPVLTDHLLGFLVGRQIDSPTHSLESLSQRKAMALARS